MMSIHPRLLPRLLTRCACRPQSVFLVLLSCALVLFLLLSLSQLSSGVSEYRQTLSTPSSSRTRHPRPSVSPHCVHIVPRNSRNDWRPFNARSFCIYPRLCLTPRRSVDTGPSLFFDSANVMNTPCTITSPTLDLNKNSPVAPALAVNSSAICPNVSQKTLCAHGLYNETHFDATCPYIGNISSMNDRLVDSSLARNDTLTVIIPTLKHLENIFHFGQVIGALSHMASHLPDILETLSPDGGARDMPPNLVLLFRGALPSSFGDWQDKVTKAVVRQRLIRHTGFKSVSVRSTFENHWFMKEFSKEPSYRLDPAAAVSASGSSICTGLTVLLGERLDINTWPFAHDDHATAIVWPFAMRNASISTAEGGSVPLEALALRKAIYMESKVSSRIPETLLSSGTPGFVAPGKLLLEFPPKVLAYARRNNGSDPLPGQPVTHGPVRRLRDADEKWFEAMLGEEADKHGFEYTRVQPHVGMPFEEQMKEYARAGIIIGLHGANLFNSIVAPPFAALLEIANAELACYINGGNAGLAFMSYRPVRTPLVKESGCPPENSFYGFLCRMHVAWRPIFVDAEEDRVQIRMMVERGVQHVLDLRRRFEHLGGVPVTFDDKANTYNIVWEDARGRE